MVQIDEKNGNLSKKKLELIFDSGTFVELSAYTKRENSNEDLESVVCGYGAVCGKLAFAFVQDSGRTKGAFSERHSRKITEMYSLAIKNGAPVIGVWLVGSLRIRKIYEMRFRCFGNNSSDSGSGRNLRRHVSGHRLHV